LIPWDLSPVQQDVGCVQDDPLTIDVEATWRAHQRFHDNWNERVATERTAMQTIRPDVVLADTPYLALAAGHQAPIPTVALASFTWDIVLTDFEAPSPIDKTALIESMRHAYAQTDLALRITPAPKLNLFSKMIDISPIAEPAASARAQLANALHLKADEQTVLVGFGGIPLASLPFDRLTQLKGYRLLVDGPVRNHNVPIISTQSLPFSFKTLMASVDIIMTKPGYGTLVEAVALQTPIVYVRRYNFADEQPLVEYLHRHGRGIELSRDNFREGRWQEALTQVGSVPTPASPPPSPVGADEAARAVAPYLS
jgi:hypothetical protein